ncbi:hypothetical protein [Cytobacillus oceanisediminis]|uniref:hypothetical protein n=1 Tax=Cytobacillus oceanisediminis TaxID=665099 RepID=UPI001FB25B54|nr:hypothetical protein [Cytobacillus oceanisediminis]UOE57998.1 hypothetical protein IRB79_27405 [Cytobacillus oceanisediminis]
MIYKHLGHDPLVEGYCAYFDCSFPEHYRINWFGEVWQYSWIWIPILIIIVVQVRKNRKILKDYIRNHWVKISFCMVSIGALTGLYFGLNPIVREALQIRETYAFAQDAMRDENYINALDYFSEVKTYKDSKKQIEGIHIKVSEIVVQRVKERKIYGDTEQYLDILAGIPQYKEEAHRLKNKVKKMKKEDEDKEKAKLKQTVPYEGMHEDSISLSAWGPPTEIYKDINYNSLRTDRQVKHYKWIERDSSGRIIKIKTLMVKNQFVWGEVEVHNYYQN